MFTPRAVDRLRPEVQRISAELLAGSGRSTFDRSATTPPYSIAVICLLLGVPLDRSAQLLELVARHREDVRAVQHRDRAAAKTAGGEFIDYVRTLIAARRAAPGEDLVSGLVEVADSGDRLTDDEIVCTVIVLLNAGHEATVNTLGNGMRAALKHPGQRAR